MYFHSGIISALAFSPDYSGLYAAGSFSGTVSLYTEDTGATPVQHIDGVTGGGVTQVCLCIGTIIDADRGDLGRVPSAKPSDDVRGIPSVNCYTSL